MRKFFKALFYVLLVASAVAAAIVVAVYQAAHTTPEFYQQAMELPPEAAVEATEELEQEVSQLQEEVESEGRWEASFTDKQINAWLATELPRQFPRALPPSVANPRVKLKEDAISLAFQYSDPRVSAIVLAVLEVKLTEDPNRLYLRLRQLQAGLLPAPTQKIIARIAAAAERSGMPVEWTEVDGDPVAVVTLPDRVPQSERGKKDLHLALQSLELEEGVVRLSGVSETLKEACDQQKRESAWR